MKRLKMYVGKYSKLIGEHKPWVVFGLIFGIYYVSVSLLNTSTRCVYKNIFGIPCPGCGMTRSYSHLLEGDLQAAFYDHPLFLLVPIILILSIVLFRIKINTKAYKIVSSVLLFIAFLFIVVYVVRMVLYFPHQEPLRFYDKGLYPTLIRHLKNLFK
jgi:hypothetical protein